MTASPGLYRRFPAASNPARLDAPTSATLVLLRRWNAGERDALGDLVGRHLEFVRRLVHGRLGPQLRKRAETQDLVQEAMIRLLRYGPRFEVADDRHFRALVARVVENTIRDEVRRIRRVVRDVDRERGESVLILDPQIDASATPSEAASRDEQRAWVQLALELLDAPDREIIMLREWERLEYPEIAELLGGTEASVRKRFQRALPKLHRTMIRLRARGAAALLDERTSPDSEP